MTSPDCVSFGTELLLLDGLARLNPLLDVTPAVSDRAVTATAEDDGMHAGIAQPPPNRRSMRIEHGCQRLETDGQSRWSGLG